MSSVIRRSSVRAFTSFGLIPRSSETIRTNLVQALSPSIFIPMRKSWNFLFVRPQAISSLGESSSGPPILLRNLCVGLVSQRSISAILPLVGAVPLSRYEGG